MNTMKSSVLFVLFAALSEFAYADILWNNGNWGRASNLTSERNTTVTESWTVDDIILSEPVVIREFHWVSIMTAGLNALGADLIVLTGDFEPVVELSDLSYSRVFDGNAYGDMEVYKMTLSGLSIELQPGRYFIGGRTVGDGVGRAVSGLNDTIFGESRAYWKSEYFGIPDWTIYDLDVAFRVHGDIIPAPPTLLALTLPGLLALRRRR